MPSQSPAQHRLMEGIAHGWHPTGLKNPPPKKVAVEFANADEAKAHHVSKIAHALGATKR
jgi:hypothetical protein